MLKYKECCFEKNSIIDLVIIPKIDISEIIEQMSSGFGHLIILDTQGKLFFNYKNSLWSIGEECMSESAKSEDSSLLSNNQMQRIDYSFISSLDELFEKLGAIKACRDYVLIIDTVTFVFDISPRSMKHFITVLWSLIYECNATIVTVNHYRHSKEQNGYKLIPRLGLLWKMCVSYQLLFKNSFQQIDCDCNQTYIDNL